MDESTLDLDRLSTTSAGLSTVGYARIGNRWSRVPGRADKNSLKRRTNKNAALAASACSPDGDPQTYALLYCSVFKEQTPAPGPFRAGSLTAPNRRGARVTTDIIASGQGAVKAKSGRSARALGLRGAPTGVGLLNMATARRCVPPGRAPEPSPAVLRLSV